MSANNKNHAKDFQKRLKRIDKSVRKGNRAKVAPRTGVMDHNEQMRRKARKKTISWKGVFKTLLLLWVLFTGLKAFMSHQMGRVAYEERVAELRAGTTAERFASYTLERGAVMDMIDRFRNRAENASGTDAGTQATGETTTDQPTGEQQTPETNQAPAAETEAPETDQTGQSN